MAWFQIAWNREAPVTHGLSTALAKFRAALKPLTVTGVVLRSLKTQLAFRRLGIAVLQAWVTPAGQTQKLVQVPRLELLLGWISGGICAADVEVDRPVDPCVAFALLETFAARLGKPAMVLHRPNDTVRLTRLVNGVREIRGVATVPGFSLRDVTTSAGERPTVRVSDLITQLSVNDRTITSGIAITPALLEVVHVAPVVGARNPRVSQRRSRDEDEDQRREKGEEEKGRRRLHRSFVCRLLGPGRSFL